MRTAPAGYQPVTHYENFPVASWLCPPPLRAPIAAIYWFARCADDIADEGQASASQRLALLQAYGEDLLAVARSATAAHSGKWPAVFAPLQAALHQYELPLDLLQDLLSAFTQDVRYSRDGTRYASQGELLDYCRRSANPVGRLLLHLYARQYQLQLGSAALAQSDCICSALQLINFWQDLGLDIGRGRYYLPLDACRSHGVALADMLALRQTPAATQLIASQVHQARALMRNGMQLPLQLPGRAGWELRLVVQGGMRVLDKIAAGGYQTLARRPALAAWDAPLLLWRALWMQAGPR